MKKAIIITVLSIFFSGTVFAVEFGEVDIHGFISQGFLQSDDHKFYFADTDDGTYEFNEFGINFATDLTDNLRLGMQLLARDLGSLGNDKVNVDWAYADYRFRNWLGLRVGKIKKPSGIFNQSRDVDAARTCIFLPSSMYNDAYRDAQLGNKGFGIYGTLPGHVDYQIAYGIFDLPKDSAVVTVVSANMGGLEPSSIMVDNTFAGQLLWSTPLDGLRIGGSAGNYKFTLDYMVPLPPTYTSVMPVELIVKGDLIIGSIEYTYDNFMFTAEYRVQSSEFVTNGTAAPETDAEDYYVMVSYRFTDLFELGAYYSVHYGDKDDKDGDDRPAGDFKEEAWLKDFTLTGRFDINEYWIFKLEGHLMDGLSDVDFSESDDPADPDPDWYMFAAKLSYSF